MPTLEAVFQAAEAIGPNERWRRWLACGEHDVSALPLVAVGGTGPIRYCSTCYTAWSPTGTPLNQPEQTDFVVCPTCGSAMDDATRITHIAPGHSEHIVGYCRRCSRQYDINAETGAVASFTWSPLCRVCRREVQPVHGSSDGVTVEYRCPEHTEQRWEYGPNQDQWTWRGVPFPV